MNRIVPVLLVAAAVGLHFSYCEWEMCKHQRILDDDLSRRAISVHPDPDSFDVFLLAKSADEYNEAATYGLYVPVLFIIAAIVVARLESS